MAAPLPRADWTRLRDEHRRRALPVIESVQERSRVGGRHPVEDFLFDYYNLRAGELLHFHPGAQVVLDDAPEYAGRSGYLVSRGVARFDTDAFLARRGPTVARANLILRATHPRAPNLACFGMHEWAMVYGLRPDQTRHPYLELRLQPEEIVQVVDRVGVRCSHVDAFRFFTPDAVRLNQLTPTRATQPELEQPGCLHANMDLYRWAGKLVGLVDSTLLFDTFELARDIRLLDMRASAYDLTGWGHQPVRVETASGRLEYATAQRGFAARAQQLRARLISALDGVGVGPGWTPPGAASARADVAHTTGDPRS